MEIDTQKPARKNDNHPWIRRFVSIQKLKAARKEAAKRYQREYWRQRRAEEKAYKARSPHELSIAHHPDTD